VRAASGAAQRFGHRRRQALELAAGALEARLVLHRRRRGAHVEPQDARGEAVLDRLVEGLQRLLVAAEGVEHLAEAAPRPAVGRPREEGRLEISVEDEGPGVPSGEEEHIFERFVRTEVARGRPGGAGLGLPISRCLAEVHGGTLRLARNGPGGATFVVRLARGEPVGASAPGADVVIGRS
jgi:C4-dicarboxylate-specific signal transduction histidine kinase